MNRKLLAISLLGAVSLTAAAAQAQGLNDQEKVGPSELRVTHGIGSNPNPTVEETVVRQQIHDAGYGGVTMLQRMPDGTWQAQVFKNQAFYEVTLDNAGHVTQR